MVKHRVSTWLKKHKKPILILIIITLIGLGVWGLFFASQDDSAVLRTEPDSAQAAPEVPKYYSPLTGLQTSEEKSKRPVTSVVIENSPDARPQSSLHEAGFIFEAIAEGGITRYVAFYQEKRPDPIGPVRSMRPYWIDWILPFDASAAHVGGSAIAQQQVINFGVKDLDQFYNPEAYYRVNYRYSPHNVYTNFTRLDKLNKQKGFTSSEFKPWKRKNENPKDVVEAKKITIAPSSIQYQSDYSYVKSCNCYYRFNGGQKHVDAETGKRIQPKVVIAINTPVSINYITGRNVYNLVGSGKATVFQDGRVIKGKWRKKSREAMMTFEIANGNEIKLNRGQVWITALSPSQNPTYTK